MENRTLTDEIYDELLDGLGKGMDWTAFIARHASSKGPLYNAIGRFFNDVGAKVKALGEVQAQLDEARRKLDSVERRKEEAESNIAALEGRENTLNKEVEVLESKLAEKGELASHLAELMKLGFNVTRLHRLREALGEIGAKHGLEGKEAVSQFFAELKGYDAKTGFAAEVRRLETIITTKNLEAERWKAEEAALRRRHNDLKGDIDAVHGLLAKGVKTGQIADWQRILNQVESLEQFSASLAEYVDITKLLGARKKEVAACELGLSQAQSQLETLKEERAKIEAAIDAIKVAGIKEVKAMTEAAEKELRVVAASEISKAEAIGREVRKEFASYFAQMEKLLEKAVHLGQELGRSEEQLQRYERVKDAIESHAVASEEAAK